MKKILVLIIGILLGNIGMLLWIILSNSLIEIDPNKVVIYSGLLGFSGAMIAVVGTYLISINQVKMEMKNQKESNKLQIKFKNIEEIVSILITLKYILEQVEMELRLPYSKQKISKDILNEKEVYVESENLKNLKKTANELFKYSSTFFEYQKPRGLDNKNDITKIVNLIIELTIVDMKKYELEMTYYSKYNTTYGYVVSEEDRKNIILLRTVINNNYDLFIIKLESLSK